MMGPVDPADDPEMRWANMRLLELSGQQRLPLPGVTPPDAAEYLDAMQKSGKGMKKHPRIR